MFELIASLAGPILGGLIQGDSAEDAASAQGESTAAAIAENRRQYDQSRADLAPWRDTGGAAVNRLSYLLGISGKGGRPTDSYTMDDFLDYNRRAAPPWYQSPGPQATDAQSQYDRYKSGSGWSPEEMRGLGFRDLGSGTAETDPEFGSLNRKFTLADFWDDPVTKASYQFGLDEGTKALGNMAGARGNRNSGAQLKALTRFTTDYTGQQAGQSYNRFYGDQDRTFNRLSGVAGTGQTAATNTAQFGQNTANTVGGLMAAQGNARGAAAIAGGNAMGGALSGIGNYFQQQNTLNKILGSGGGYGNYSGYSGYQGNSNPYLMSNTYE